MATKTFSTHVRTSLPTKGLVESTDKQKVKQLTEAKRQGVEDGYNGVIGTDLSPFEQKVMHECKAMITDIENQTDQWVEDTPTHDMIIQSWSSSTEEKTVDERLFHSEYESTVEIIEVQKVELRQSVVLCDQSIEEHQKEKEALVQSLGYRPIKKPLYKKLSHFILLTILCSAEMPLNYTSLVKISDDLPIFWCWLLSAFISIVIGIASHHAGKFLKNEEYMLARLPIAAIALILFVILYLRIAEGGSMILVLLNFSIAIIAVISSYIAEPKKTDERELYFLQDKAEKEKLKERIKLQEAYTQFEISSQKELMEKVRIHAKDMMESKTYKQAYEEKRASVVRIIEGCKTQMVAQIEAHANEVLYVYRTARQNAYNAKQKRS